MISVGVGVVVRLGVCLTVLSSSSVSSSSSDSGSSSSGFSNAQSGSLSLRSGTCASRCFAAVPENFV